MKWKNTDHSGQWVYHTLQIHVVLLPFEWVWIIRSLSVGVDYQAPNSNPNTVALWPTVTAWDWRKSRNNNKLLLVNPTQCQLVQSGWTRSLPTCSLLTHLHMRKTVWQSWVYIYTCFNVNIDLHVSSYFLCRWTRKQTKSSPCPVTRIWIQSELWLWEEWQVRISDEKQVRACLSH